MTKLVRMLFLRGMTLVVCGLALVLARAPATLAAPTMGTILTVNSSLDEIDKNPGDGKCVSKPSKKCTLRAAIMENNALGGNTIVLPAGSYVLSIQGVGEDNDATGDLDVTANLTLQGAGSSTTTIDANGLDRVLHIVGGKTKISGVKIMDGNAPTSGGGIFIAASAKLTLLKSIVSDNYAAYSGGGIGNFGTFVVKSSTIGFANYGNSNGGGIANTGKLRVIKSYIYSNAANFNAGYGGGLDNYGTAFINASTFYHDESNEGGAIRNSGTLTLVNSTLNTNTANVEGGGIHNAGGTLNVFSTTIAENSAPNGATAGGIYNSAGTVNLRNSLLDLNYAGVVDDDCEGTIQSQDYNLVFGTSGCTLNGDQHSVVGISSSVGALANNGGPTPTEALPDGSIAIDYIPIAKCTDNQNKPLLRDQRGSPRPTDGNGDGKKRCDIGAYER